VHGRGTETMNVKTKNRVLDLRLWLMALGLLGILLINGVLASVLSRSVAESLVQREAQVTQEFLNSIIASEGTAADLFVAPAPSPALASFASHVRSLPGTVRANIYSPDGFIRHSTEGNLVGVQFRDNEELKESFAGAAISKLETISESNKPEHLALNQFAGEQLIEAYIPVVDAAGKVVTVVEFYRKATAVKATLDDITAKIWIAAALNALILILGMLAAIVLSKGRVGK
jgi:two-component system, NtrC family, sensor histidine kinase HydH